MDTTSLIAQVLSYVLPLVPAEWGADLVSLGAILVAICAIVARHWSRPADGSKWLLIYNIINALAQNRKQAANAQDVSSKKENTQ